MAEKGTPHGRFQRAVERRDLLGAEAAAREIGTLSLADALSFLMLLAAKEPRRFERAAVRWHGRFAIEVQGLEVADSQMLLGAVAGLRKSAPRVPLETIALVADRFRSTSVALVAKRRLR